MRSKGLEFDQVFLVGAEESLFPGSRAIQSGSMEEIEEERRLAYVAITRARKNLTITTARNRMVFGQTQCNPVSRFVREIPAKFLEEIGGGVFDKTLSTGGKQGMTAFPSTQSAGFASRQGTGSGGSGSSHGFDDTSGGLRSKPRNGPFDFGDMLMKSKTPPTVSADDKPYLRSSDIKVGDEVHHEKFGAGKIRMILPVADDAILEIQFESYGIKKLLTKQAKLTK